jgi:predicted TIM-barrel fold metal-dependent hydrolase
MIWDLHCHLSGIAGSTPHERMARLIEVADRMGIERVVVSMGLSFLTEPTPDDLKRQNDELIEALSHWHHRAFGLCYVSPAHPEVSLQEIERHIVKGPLIGLKLWVAKRCSDEAIDPLVELAASHQALIFQHTWYKATGNLPGESTPEDFVALARRHPRIPLVLGHTGGDWERGIRAVRSLENVSVDLAGSDPTSGMTEMAVRELGAERVLYGSDAGGRSFASQLAKVRGAVIPEPAKQLILGENLKRLLRPILTAKGVRFE